jgi:hypothetical protein
VSGETADPDSTDASYGGLDVKGFDMPDRAAKDSIS